VYRSIFEIVPFTSHRDHEDWAWLLEAWHIAGARVEFVWEPLVIYNIDTESISRSRRMNWRDSLHWAERYRKWLTPRAYNSFLATKVALKAKRAGEFKGVAEIFMTVVNNRPRLLDVLFLVGVGMLPNALLQAAWRRSLSSGEGSETHPRAGATR